VLNQLAQHRHSLRGDMGDSGRSSPTNIKAEAERRLAGG